MEEQDWKNIIDELTQQITQISIDRAVARADVKKLLKINESQREELQSVYAELNTAREEIQTVSIKKAK
jgi:hypothetical protein